MIKHLLSVVALSAAFIATAQTNLDFETWASGSPTGWTTYNAGVPGSVSQVTTGAPQGASAAKLQTGACSFCPGLGLPSKLPGFVYQKVAWTGVPTSFDAYVDYNVAANDTAVLGMYASSGGTGNVVYLAGQRFTGVGGGWTMMNFPFTLVGAGTVDTLEILGASSDSLPLGTTSVQNTASILYVDGIVINTVTGQQEAIAIADYFVYPNPCNDELNIVMKNEGAAKVEIFDITGRLVASKNVSGKKVKIETAEYSSGIYIYRILDASNKQLKTSKFNVSR